MARPRRRFALAALAVLATTPVFASCDDPAWDTGAITALLVAPVPAASGATLDRSIESGLEITLAPQADVRLDLPPERPARNPEPLAGLLHFGPGETGTYRIALSAAAWIDVVQDGAYLPSAGSVDFLDCPDLRKIVAFEIGAGPFTLQLSDAAVPSIAAAITPAP